MEIKDITVSSEVMGLRISVLKLSFIDITELRTKILILENETYCSRKFDEIIKTRKL